LVNADLDFAVFNEANAVGANEVRLLCRPDFVREEQGSDEQEEWGFHRFLSDRIGVTQS
jgi:hypothetical protein